MEDIYTDPLRQPWRFIMMIPLRVPITLLGQWGPLASEVHVLLSPGARWLMSAVGVGLVLLLAHVMWPLLRSDRVARFWALGMIFCATIMASAAPQNRYLLFTGIGAMGLMAQHLTTPTLRGGGRLLNRGVVIALVAIHLIASPLVLLAMSRYPIGPESFHDSIATLPDISQADAGRDWLIVNHPFPPHVMSLLCGRAVDGAAMPARMRVLAPGARPMRIERPDESSLLISIEGGGMFPTLSSRLGYSQLQPLHAGNTVELSDMTVHVLECAPDGPNKLLYHFHRPLEDQSLRWFCWRDWHFVRFDPPPIGASIELDGSGIPI
jgi:hypothetical protein